jgi:hypothetical protein
MHTHLDGCPYRHEVVLADVELAGDLESVPRTPRPGRTASCSSSHWVSTPPGGCWPPDPPAELTCHSANPDLRYLTTTYETLLERSGLPAGITDVRWSAQVPLQHRIAGTYRTGPLFLTGDAAHTHSPAGGQGMNTGLRDATNLGWKLACATQSEDAITGTPTLLDGYELERRPVADRIMHLTNAVFWAESGTDPLARAARMIAATIGWRCCGVGARPTAGRHDGCGCAKTDPAASVQPLTGPRCRWVPSTGLGERHGGVQRTNAHAPAQGHRKDATSQAAISGSGRTSRCALPQALDGRSRLARVSLPGRRPVADPSQVA